MVNGFVGDDIIEGGLGDDLLNGGEGSDTYVFNMGDGDDIVQDTGLDDLDVMQFTDYASTDATFQRLTLNSNDLLITFANGDQIIIIDTLSGNRFSTVESFQFTDVTLSITDILAGL